MDMEDKLPEKQYVFNVWLKETSPDEGVLVSAECHRHALELAVEHWTFECKEKVYFPYDEEVLIFVDQLINLKEVYSSKLYTYTLQVTSVTSVANEVEEYS